MLPGVSGGQSVAEFLESQPDDLLRMVVADGVAKARDVLLPLVEGRLTPLPTTGDADSVMVVDGVVRVGGDLVKGQQWHTRALLDLIVVGQRLPFAKCPVCGRVFVRKGLKARCSRDCTQKYHDKKRAGTKKRKDQTKQAVKKHRAKKKREARKKKGD